jgi:glucoamylase
LLDFLNIKIWLAVPLLAASGAVLVSGGSAVDPPAPRGFPGVVPAFLAEGEEAGGRDRGFKRSREGSERAAVRDREGSGGAAIRRDRRWLAQARPLGDSAPPWAWRMYRRSLLVLRALVDPHSGAAVAGARAGWAYVWPRDAGAIAIALTEAGYRAEARRIARFLLGLDLDAAARFDWAGEPVEGRDAQGDAAGWVAAAAQAAGIPVGSDVSRGAVGDSAGDPSPPIGFGSPVMWRGRADYQEKDGGDYLGNAIAAAFAGGSRAATYRRQAAHRPHGASIASEFGGRGGLVRSAGDPDSGHDAAAAWAVRPFPQPRLFAAVRLTLLRLVAERESRFGLVPSEDWDGGEDPWTAPTAWTAWALASLARIQHGGEIHNGGSDRVGARDRRAALALMGDLRRAATARGLLPERVDAETGRPVSTTPLAWSHAFAILAIRELWPPQDSR